MNEDKAAVLVRMPKDLKQRLQKQAKEQGFLKSDDYVFTIA